MKKFYDLRDEALKALEALEVLRIADEKASGGAGSSYRVIEAAVAHYAGFENRNEWVDILRENSSETGNETASEIISAIVGSLSDDEIADVIPEDVRIRIYRSQKRKFVEEDIRSWLEDSEMTADEDEIKDAVDWFEDKEECGVPYWDNISNAVDMTIGSNN